MVLNSKDLRAMSQIGQDAALAFVEDNDWETTVLRWKLKINAETGMDAALMYIWNAMGRYDLGKLCREWLAYGYNGHAASVLEYITRETGEAPKPSLIGSEV